MTFWVQQRTPVTGLGLDRRHGHGLALVLVLVRVRVRAQLHQSYMGIQFNSFSTC